MVALDKISVTRISGKYETLQIESRSTSRQSFSASVYIQQHFRSLGDPDFL